MWERVVCVSELCGTVGQSCCVCVKELHEKELSLGPWESQVCQWANVVCACVSVRQSPVQ